MWCRTSTLKEGWIRLHWVGLSWQMRYHPWPDLASITVRNQWEAILGISFKKGTSQQSACPQLWFWEDCSKETGFFFVGWSISYTLWSAKYPRLDVSHMEIFCTCSARYAALLCFLMKSLASFFQWTAASFRRSEFSHKCIAVLSVKLTKFSCLALFVEEWSLLKMVWLTCTLWTYLEHSKQKIPTFWVFFVNKRE